MADKKYDGWSVKQIEHEILNVRLVDLIMEKELSFTLAEKAKLENDHYALAFSYTFLSDCFLACRENNNCITYLNYARELSETGNYEDLLVRIYNYYGMFYNSINDEVNALDYFLKSLDISERQKNFMQMASAYNNIATCFDVKHDYKEAVLYYKKSFEVLSDTDPGLRYSKAVILTNLCGCAYKLNQTEEMERILSSIQIICQGEDKEKYILDMLHLFCITMKQHLLKEYTDFYRTLDELLGLQEHVENRRLIYQIFTTICDLLLQMGDQPYTKRILEVLSDINQKNNIKAKKELQKLIVRYCQLFEPVERQLAALQEYYNIITSIEDMGQESYSAGLMAKLELYNSKVKQGNLKKEKEHLEQLMNMDDLCGIRNRRCLNRDLADNRTAAGTVGIAMLDIDFFKEYNDTYGHHKGDLALMAVGKTLKAITSDNIYTYRYGGDEFTIIFRNQTEDNVRQIIERVQAGILEMGIPHIGSKTNDRLTLSCGYSYTDQVDKDMQELLNEADLNLYQSKKRRRLS